MKIKVEYMPDICVLHYGDSKTFVPKPIGEIIDVLNVRHQKDRDAVAVCKNVVEYGDANPAMRDDADNFFYHIYIAASEVLKQS